MNYVYLLRCRDGSLYCGWTDDLAARLRAHNSGRGAKYTRSRTPVELAYYEACPDAHAARSREWHIKRLSREEKLALVESRMLKCVSVAEMRESDRRTIASGASGRRLMYRAAMAVYLAGGWAGETVIACGGGNNGGDGFALACILARRGQRVCVVTLSDRRSDEGEYYARQAGALGVGIRPYAPGAFAGCDTIVDCLLGTGFSGGVREPCRSAIEEINAASARVVSVDIPSGMNGDTGAAETAVRAGLCVTIGYLKTGLLAPEAGAYIGRLICADIGIALTRAEYRVCPAELWSETYAAREELKKGPPWLDGAVIDTSACEEEMESAE